MDNMIVVALMVLGLIVINPLLSANTTKKVATTSDQTEDQDSDSSDQEDGDSDEDVIMMDEDEGTEKN